MSEPVLIVDDSLTVRMDLARAFEGAGFRPLPCATAQEAREALAREPIALVVLDVILPDSDGIEFLKELRAAPATSTAAVLLLSSESEVRDRIRGLKTGADEYVGKPYDAAFLVARARELERSRARVVRHGPSVLVIDDSGTFREELRKALEARGYEVLLAGTGEEGLRLAADARPSAIIVDGMLPGIEGATVIRRLRLDVALRSTPCVLLTGSGDRGAELRALDAGADVFERKEEEIEVIMARLAAVLRTTGQPSEDEGTASLLGPKRILAVDDSQTYLHELADALRGEGYDVVLARSGQEALDLLAVQPVDCILLDLLMPDLGGQETCWRIKSAPVLREIPLIMLTAVEDRAAMIEGLGAGADDYISKSSDMDVLKARVRAQIRRRQFEDESRGIRERLLHMEREAGEARAARALAETRAVLVDELERKNKELEAFSYSVSHDLRTPLRAIDGFSKVLLDCYRDQLDEEGRRLLGIVRDNTRRMSQLIDDLLALSHAGRSVMHPTTIDMRELALSVCEQLRCGEEGRPLEIRVGDLPPAHGDLGLIRQVFANLIGNSVKYTRPRDSARIDVTGCIEADQCVYTVKDNGVGFDMAFASKLFGVFQRLHGTDEFEGTGVGLALVQRIVERHGGKISAEGKVNEGATVRFSLPNRPGG